MGKFKAGGATNIQIQQQDFKAVDGHFTIPDHLDKHAKAHGLKRAETLRVETPPARHLLDAQGHPIQVRPQQQGGHLPPPAPLPPLQSAPMPPLPIPAPQPAPPQPQPGNAPPATAIPLPIPAPLPATADSTQAPAPPPPAAPELIEPTVGLNPDLGGKMLGSDPLPDQQPAPAPQAPAPAAAPQQSGGADPDRL